MIFLAFSFLCAKRKWGENERVRSTLEVRFRLLRENDTDDLVDSNSTLPASFPRRIQVSYEDFLHVKRKV